MSDTERYAGHTTRARASKPRTWVATIEAVLFQLATSTRIERPPAPLAVHVSEA